MAFATLMMSICGGIGLYMGISDYINPTGYYQTYSEFKDTKSYDKEGKRQSPGKEEQLKEEYKTYFEDEKKRTKDQAKGTIVNSIGFILIPFPIFLYFNKQRKGKDEET